jgi:hypothetical protein
MLRRAAISAAQLLVSGVLFGLVLLAWSCGPPPPRQRCSGEEREQLQEDDGEAEESEGPCSPQ